MSDEELADAVGDVEEFIYGLWLELGEVRREARRGGRIGQGRLYDMALSTRRFVAARLWSLADGMEGGEATMAADEARAEMRDIASDMCAAGIHLMDGAARCTRRGDGMDAGVARPVVGETLDRLDALRARLADLGERVAAVEDGGDDR